ncbi:MAG: aminotransferase class III-fold pyridoxal phosphate-dependent enzyme, partial [Candidatus Omnitrophica bacterium]|nr:aminotransferase class III-fold pyridoxal phosphate-dependent enzyme [Candidatus Omnitrophota bacterium]
MNSVQKASVLNSKKTLSDEELLKLEAKYCSWGDTVHYVEKPNIFAECRGSCLYDRDGTEFLDLQMWYSACNFGYNNERVKNALKKQIERLPQLACQYLHEEKIRLAAALAERMERVFEEKGRIHFNVGGSQSLEDSLKLVRKNSGKSLMFA